MRTKKKPPPPRAEPPWYTVCVRIEILECGEPIQKTGATLGYAADKGAAERKFREIRDATDDDYRYIPPSLDEEQLQLL